MGVHDLLVGFDGLDRAAGDAAELVGTEPGRLLHQRRLHDLALLRAHAVGQLAGGADDHCRVLWGDEPGVQGFGGGVVPGVQLARQRDLAGCVRTRHGGGLREPGVGTGEPGVLGDLGLICSRDELQLQASMRRVARSSSATTSACSPANQRLGGAGVHPVQQCVHLGHAREHRVGAVGVEVEECCHGTILYRTYVRVKSELRNVDRAKETSEDSNHSGRVKRPETEKAAQGTAR